MSDQDRFELDLRTAVGAYVGAISSDLDAARLARTIASAELPRRVRLAGIPWTFNPMSRLAWAVLMAALLIAATLMLAIGTLPPVELRAVIPEMPAIYACSPGSTPDQPGAFEQARPPLGDIRVAMDRDSGRIVAVVPLDGAVGWDTWVYDVCTNAWSHTGARGALLNADRIPELVYDWRLDLTIAMSEWGRTSQYDVEANRWETSTATSVASAQLIQRLAYDPVSGLVLAQAPTMGDYMTGLSQLWSYDPKASVWTDLTQSGGGPTPSMGDHTVIAFDTNAARLVAVNFDLHLTWVLDPSTGEWNRPAVSTPSLNTAWSASGGEIAYDEAAERIVVYTDGLAAAYDTINEKWEIVFATGSDEDEGRAGPQARLGQRMVYDPTNRRLVVIGSGDDVWAFETATRTWRQLLAPSHLISR